MIHILATSLSGSQHIVTGGVRDGESYAWETAEEALAHLRRVGWTDVRQAVSVKDLQSSLVITWDDQSKTEHQRGSDQITWLCGGPTGEKISKSKEN